MIFEAASLLLREADLCSDLTLSFIDIVKQAEVSCLVA